MALTLNGSYGIEVSRLTVTKTPAQEESPLTNDDQTYYIDTAAPGSVVPESVWEDITTQLSEKPATVKGIDYPVVPCDILQANWMLNFHLGSTGLAINVPFHSFLGAEVGNTGKCPILLRKVGSTQERK
jgi:hypothetical protein